jgi:ferredoxin
MAKIIITDDCIGCGACQAVNEEYFEIVDGKAKGKKDVTSEEIVKDAVDACPVEAIKVK